MLTESVGLLCKGMYEGKIPDVLTLTSLPTSSELDYVGSEDFDKVMLEEILPQAVQEKGIDFYDLYTIDYHWVLRALRILNYGPYFTTNSLYCSDCGPSYGEYQVRLDAIDCVPPPEGATASVVIPKEEFFDVKSDVEMRLLTMRESINANKDPLFKDKKGKQNTEFARVCYMISKLNNNSNMNVLEKKMYIENNFSSADFKILKDTAYSKMDYGLRAAGHATCPKCKQLKASFLALDDDRFFRPTLDDLRRWRDDRNSGGEKDVPASTSKNA